MVTTVFDVPWQVIPMPVNANGEGPEIDQEKVVRTEWLVWTADDCLSDVCSCQSEALAQHIVNLHNRSLRDKL